MKRAGHSYLDLTALPEVGAHLLSPRPTWLWNAADATLLWANAAGAALLGASSIEQALEGGESASTLADAASVAEGLPPTAPGMAKLRFEPGGETLWCLVSRIESGGENGLLAVAADERGTNDSLSLRAGRLAQALAADGMIVAVAADDGRIIAASQGLGALPDGEAGIGTLVAKADPDVARPAKQIARFGRERRPAGAAIAATPEGVFHLVIVGPPVSKDEAPQVIAPPATDTEPADEKPAKESQQPAKRFTFRIGTERQFVEISPEFHEIIGHDADALIGEDWDNLAGRLGLDTKQTVARALSRRDTFASVPVDWPTADGGSASLSLTAIPSFGRGGAFEGFTGFAVLRDRANGKSEVTTPEPAAAKPEPPREEEGSNVVRLPSADRAPAAARSSHLNGDEQDAFRRIAEALRSVTPKAPAETKTKPEPPTRVTPPAPIAATAPDRISRRLLDRVPTGLAVFRGRSLLFANRAFLDQLGYADLNALASAGGIDGLFVEGAEPGDNDDASRRMPLRAADGTVISLEARLHVVPWDERPATMLSLRGDDPAPTAELAKDQTSALARIDELEAVLDTATDGILVVDEEGRLLNLNRSAEALFGIEATDMLGRPFTELLAPESHKSAMDYLDGLARNGHQPMTEQLPPGALRKQWTVYRAVKKRRY